MRSPRPSRWPGALVPLLAALLTACPTISSYSETAYRYATTLKVESLALMEKATDPYADHATEAANLLLEIDKAYEYARGRPNNTISTRQWEILRSPDRALLGGFIARWKTEGKLSPVFITEVKENVSDAFDTISELESGKIKPDAAKLKEDQ
jgi:hypothetical protein